MAKNRPKMMSKKAFLVVVVELYFFSTQLFTTWYQTALIYNLLSRLHELFTRKFIKLGDDRKIDVI